MPRLVYEDPSNGEEVKVEIGPDYPEITIGRNPGNMVRLGNPSVSREHAKILYEDGEYTIRDLNSSNGTFINGNQVDEQIVEAGDRIRLGEFPIEFVESDADESAEFPDEVDEFSSDAAPQDATVDSDSSFDLGSIQLNEDQISEESDKPIKDTGDAMPAVGDIGSEEDDKLEELRAENERLKKQLEESDRTEKLEAKQQRIEELEQELEVEREDNKYLQNEIEELKAECASLRDELDQVSEQGDSEVIEKLEEENEKLQEKVEELEEDKEQKKKIFEDLKGDLQQLIEQNQQKQKRIKELESKLSKA